MKHIICILILLIPIYILIPKKVEEKENIPVTSETQKVVKLLNNEEVVYISLEEYIIGVVACEMPASFHIEALKAQAVAARTYALEKMNNNKEYDLKNSTSNQCYLNKDEMKEKWKQNYNFYYNRISQAVFETTNEYITYNGKIIKALYFSTSNGYTENVKSVFGGEEAYLVSVESHWDKEASTYEKIVKFNKEEFLSKLKINDKEIYNIKIKQKTDGNRVACIVINNTEFKGTTFRNLLKIRSTDFDINYDNNIITIITRGYGHGVGLSQYGANGMAKDQYQYKEILKYYYKNVEINSIN